jgi:predicted Zn-dependent peptidase
MPTEVKIDRKIMPALVSAGKIDIPHAHSHTLANGIPVYYINAGTQDVVKIELIFRAGAYNQDMPLLANTTNAMLEEGTKKHNSEEIASMLDYYGSFLETSAHQDYAVVALYSLGKHVSKVLPLLEEIIKEPTFPQEEFDVYIKTKKQRFLVDDQKVRVVAARNFPSILFGDIHPYGHAVKINEYDNLKTELLKQFHSSHYSPDGCAIIISGRVDEKHLKLLADYFGSSSWKPVSSNGSAKELPLKASTEKKHLIEKKGALQSAIKLGRPLFLKNHPDSIPFQILNTIFGGYFGSRLMANIREDKGYTYGIGSGVVFLKHAGYLQISSEVGANVCANALVEVYKEMDRLCTDLVPAEELQLVKNYLTGNFMRSMDGPFSLAERFKNIWLHGLDYSYYEKYLQTLNDITAEQLRNIAGKYLAKDSIYELVVGAR